MKLAAVAIGVLLCSSSCGLAQSAGSAGGSASGGTGTSAATGASANTLSNGSTINGTVGSPGANTSNALNRGTTGNNQGVQANPSPAAGNAVNTPAANAAVQSLGNTDTAILKK